MICNSCELPIGEGAASCTHCGGDVETLVRPRRRLLDTLRLRRRATDTDTQKAKVPCPLCKELVVAEALRCRHCGGILDPRYKEIRARRIRGQINAASWIVYVLGLLCLMLFRPLGVAAIGVGFALSILYYVIPADGGSGPSNLFTWRGLARHLQKQINLERATVFFLPRYPKLRIALVGTPLIAAFFGYVVNYALLQQPVDDILKSSRAFDGMKVSAHYKYWVIPGKIVFDLEDVSAKQSRLVVHTAFLEFAERMKNGTFEEVELSYQGKSKFVIGGTAFRNLGVEYERRNYSAVLAGFSQTMGILGPGKPVKPPTTELDAVIDFHNQWYANDELSRPLSTADGVPATPAP